MRQVGDRLIPVGVTSGRVHPLSGEINLGEQGENTNEGEGRNSRRSRRRQHQQQPQDLNQFLGTMGLGGQDLEEVSLLIWQMSYLILPLTISVDAHGGHAIITNRA